MKHSIRATKKNIEALTKKLYPYNRLFAREAFDLGYTIYIYPELNTFRIQHKGKSHFIVGIFTPVNNMASLHIVRRKYLTNKLLEEAGVPVSNSVRITKTKFDKGDWSIDSLEYPLVVKPGRDTLKGDGVVTNVQSLREATRHLKNGFKDHRVMLVEEFRSGLDDYRVTVLDGKVIGVLRRVRPYVIGDGKSSVKKLLLARNEERKNNKQIKLGMVQMDADLKNTLRDQGLRLGSVPKEGQEVRLKQVCNLGAGGEVHDATELISEENKKLAIKIAKTLGLRLAGIDFLCQDISKSLVKTGGVIIEVNEDPDISMHQYPQQGKPRNVARKIMQAVVK